MIEHKMLGYRFLHFHAGSQARNGNRRTHQQPQQPQRRRRMFACFSFQWSQPLPWVYRQTLAFFLSKHEPDVVKTFVQPLIKCEGYGHFAWRKLPIDFQHLCTASCGLHFYSFAYAGTNVLAIRSSWVRVEPYGYFRCVD